MTQVPPKPYQDPLADGWTADPNWCSVCGAPIVSGPPAMVNGMPICPPGYVLKCQENAVTVVNNARNRLAAQQP